MSTVFYALNANKMEVRPCHFHSDCAMEPNMTQRKSWKVIGAYKAPNVLHPPNPHFLTSLTSSTVPLPICSPDCSFTREHCTPPPGWLLPEDIGQPWNPLLLGVYLANSLISFKSSFKSHSHSEASSDYLIQHYDMAPAPPPPQFQSSPHCCFLLICHCGFLTSSTTDWSMDLLTYLFFYCLSLLHYDTSSMMAGVFVCSI